MENASKALVLAGGVLISIIIISMLMLMVNSLTDYQNANAHSYDVDNIANFNNQFIAYEKDDVRGNELLTLINKVIDYNERKTEDGYEPMKLTINFSSSTGADGVDKTTKALTLDGTNRVFMKNSYITGQHVGNELSVPINTINGIINQYPSEDILKNLATGYTSIFIDDIENVSSLSDVSSENARIIKAIMKFNSCFGKEILEYRYLSYRYQSCLIIKGDMKLKVDSERPEISRNVKDDVKAYYEYMQFKRARFKCILDGTNKVQYSQKTGRIIGMTFEFTGDIS